MGRSPSPSPTLPSIPPNPSVTLSNPSITLPALPPNPLFNPSSKNNPNSNNSRSSNNNSVLGTGPASHLSLITVLGVLIIVMTLILMWLLVALIKRQKKKLERPSIEGSKDILRNPKNPLRKWLRDSTTFRRFNYLEIQKATDNFSTIIGRGGFGTVYKARFDNGLVAAVKRMYRISRQKEKELCKEMEFLGRLHHKHLVTLRGFCITKTERFLIFEYMDNGSLKEHLQAGHSKAPLDWCTRVQIAIDVAAALEYLHFFCDPPLCYRDIKSSNILLDQHFVAKVANSGLAHTTLSPTSAAHEQISTDVSGTPGHLDPEYVITRQLTVKSDVYSYGVLLLELITGIGSMQGNRDLVSWAEPYLATETKVPLMVDPGLEDNYDPEELGSLVKLVKVCTQKEGKMRPTIRQVLSFLYERLDKEGANAMQKALDGNTQSGAIATMGGSNGIETFDFSSTFSSNAHSTKAYRFDTTWVASTSEQPLIG